MENIRTILIAGATGFIGTEATHFLVQKGYVVKVLSRNLPKAQKLFGNEVIILPWPRENSVLAHPSAYSCDAILNLAGENIGTLRWNAKNKEKIRKSRTQSIKDLIRLSSSHERAPGIWIQASAIGYYGYRINKAISESAPQGDGFLSEVVADWEKALNESVCPITKVVFVRLGIVMSPDGGYLQQMLHLARLGIVACPGNGKQLISWIHINDLLAIFHYLLKTDINNKVINAVNNAPVCQMQICENLKKASGAMGIIKIPALFFQLVMGTEKTREMIMADQNVVSGVIENQQLTIQYQSFEEVFKR